MNGHSPFVSLVSGIILMVTSRRTSRVETSLAVVVFSRSAHSLARSARDWAAWANASSSALLLVGQGKSTTAWYSPATEPVRLIGATLLQGCSGVGFLFPIITPSGLRYGCLFFRPAYIANRFEETKNCRLRQFVLSNNLL